MELLEDHASRKIKYISLKSKGKIVKALQAIEFQEDTPDDETIDGFDEDEVTFLSKRLQHLYKKKIRTLVPKDSTSGKIKMTLRGSKSF